MNGIEASKKAGPGGAIQDGFGNCYTLGEDGSPISGQQGTLAYWSADTFKVVREGPERVEPYAIPFSGNDKSINCGVEEIARGFWGGEWGYKVAARLNDTVEAARREGIEQGRLTPAVEKLVDELESLRDGGCVGFDLAAAGERYLAATEPKRKTCPGCHGNEPCVGSYCSTCNGKGEVPND